MALSQKRCDPVAGTEANYQMRDYQSSIPSNTRSGVSSQNPGEAVTTRRSVINCVSRPNGMRGQ